MELHQSAKTTTHAARDTVEPVAGTASVVRQKALKQTGRVGGGVINCLPVDRDGQRRRVRGDWGWDALQR